MTTLTINAKIGEDGKLRLEVPVGLPPGQAEVVLVVQSGAANLDGAGTPATRRARSGLFVSQSTQGVDIDAALNEMSQAWQSKLADLP